MRDRERESARARERESEREIEREIDRDRDRDMAGGGLRVSAGQIGCKCPGRTFRSFTQLHRVFTRRSQ